MSETATTDTPETVAADSDNVRPIDRAKEQISEGLSRGKEKLGQARERLQQVAGEMGERLHEVSVGAQRAGAQLKERAGHAREVAQERYKKASVQLRKGYSRVREDLDSATDEVNDYVRENPGRSVLIAAAAGFLLGLLFSPRRRH